MSFTRKIVQTSIGQGGLPYTGIDLSGQRFGKLIVLERAIKPSEKISNSIWWKCQCDCGKVKNIRSISLRNGDTKSCGCLIDEARHHKALPYGHAYRNLRYQEYVKGAKRRGLEWALTTDQFSEITSSNCSYCGLQPQSANKYQNHSGYYLYNGIDRVDNSLGYTVSNSVTCCKRCNYAKGDMNKEDFINWARRVVQYNGY